MWESSGCSLGVCVCLQHRLGLGGARNPYPEQCLGAVIHTRIRIGGEIGEKQGKVWPKLVPSQEQRDTWRWQKREMDFGPCQTSSPRSFGFVASQAGAEQSKVVSPSNTTALPFGAAKSAVPAQICLSHNGDNLSNSE